MEGIKALKKCLCPWHTTHVEARHAWENEEKFKEVMERGFEFYEKIKNGEIKV